jgi:hypothetical protein
MLPDARAPKVDASDGASKRRLVVRTTWKALKYHSMMETEFAATGVLQEVRFSSLVPAVNSIPSMNVPAR